MSTRHADVSPAVRKLCQVAFGGLKAVRRASAAASQSGRIYGLIGPERRRQDHADECPVRPRHAGRRPGDPQRTRHHEALRTCPDARRPRPQFPDHENLRRHDRAGEPEARGIRASLSACSRSGGRPAASPTFGEAPRRCSSRSAWSVLPHAPAENLSHGDQRALEVGLALLSDPSVAAARRAARRRRPRTPRAAIGLHPADRGGPDRAADRAQHGRRDADLRRDRRDGAGAAAGVRFTRGDQGRSRRCAPPISGTTNERAGPCRIATCSTARRRPCTASRIDVAAGEVVSPDRPQRRRQDARC